MSLVTQLLKAEVKADVRLAHSILSNGGIVALPTETVYGLAADANNESAVAKVFEAKGRPNSHPLIVHIANKEQLSEWAVDIPAEAYLLAEKFWPGPLTLLLTKAPHVPAIVTGGLNTIGLRVPNHPVFLDLLNQSTTAYAAPSANLYKKLSPTSATQAFESLMGKIDAVLDGGDCSVGVESTIIDLTKRPFSILRSGPISLDDINSCSGILAQRPRRHDAVVPGNVEQHYQPSSPLYLVSEAEMSTLLTQTKPGHAYIHSLDNVGEPGNELHVKMPKSKSDYARVMYKILHELDAKNPTAIWCQMPRATEDWADVNDRLRRASSSPVAD